MRISTKTSATEGSFDEAMARNQALFQEHENDPQYTPREIAKVYPQLEKEVNRNTLRKVANVSGTERGKHLAKVIARIEKMRSNEAYDSWNEFDKVFPDSSLKQRQQYFIDILLLWCLPVSASVARQCLERFVEDLSTPEELSLFVSDIDVESLDDAQKDTMPQTVEGRVISLDMLTEENLNEKGREAQQRIALLQRRFGKDLPAWAEDELEACRNLIDFLDILLIAINEDYYQLWDALSYYFADFSQKVSMSERADMIIDILRVFVRRKLSLEDLPQANF